MTEITKTKLSPQVRNAPTVLIVGAGPTGLTLACELARSGVSFCLIEAGPGPQSGSRGKGIQPRTLEVFDDLGIVDRVIANGRMAMPIRLTAPDGQVTLGGAETLKDRPDLPYPASLITPQWRIEEALRLRLAEFGGAVEFGTALRSFEQSDDGVSAVVIKGGEAETVTARWLVGCERGGRFTLLSFGATPTAFASPSDLKTLHVVGQPTGPDDIADTEGYLASAYGAADRTLVLIRPDGYVALISDAGDVSAVSDYLAAISSSARVRSSS